MWQQISQATSAKTVCIGKALDQGSIINFAKKPEDEWKDADVSIAISKAARVRNEARTLKNPVYLVECDWLRWQSTLEMRAHGDGAKDHQLK